MAPFNAFDFPLPIRHLLVFGTKDCPGKDCALAALETMTLEPPSPPSAARRVAILCIVLAMVLAVRVQGAYQSPAIARDGTIYLVMARQMLQGDFHQVVHQFQYHPGYPAMIAAVAKVTGASWPDGWIMVGRWVSIVMSLLALVMLYIFASKAFDSAIAIVTVLLLGMTYGFVEICADVLSDAPAAALAMCGVVLTLKAHEALVRKEWSAWMWSAGAGLAAGAGYLVRPEALLPAALCFIVLLCRRRLDARSRAIQLASLAALAATTLACVLPYALAIGGLTQKKSFADFVLAGGGLNCLADIGWSADLFWALNRTLDRGRAIMGTPLTVLAWVCWLTLAGRYVFRIRPPERVVMKVAPVPLAMMGITLVFFVVLLTGLEVNHPRYISTRHMLLPILLLVPCAGAGLFTLVQWTLWLLERRADARIAAGRPAKGFLAYLSARPGWAVSAWLLVLIAAVGVNALRVPQEGKSCYRQIGLEVRRLAGPGHRVLAPDSWPAFYADSPAEQFMVGAVRLESPDMASPDAVYRRAAEGKFEFVSIYNRVLKQCGNGQIVAQLERDGRFKLITCCRSKDQAAWLFVVATGK